MATRPTSRPSWRSSASRTLRRLLPPPNSPGARPRVALLGIGQELNGDDAAGVLVARRLQPLVGQASVVKPQPSQGPGASPGPCEFLVIEAAHAPENCLGPLLRFAPQLVIFVDAADLGEAPGTIRWLSWEETAGLGGSTHTLSPAMLARHLIIPALGCAVAVLAVQAADTTIGAPPTPPVTTAVDEIVRGLAGLLGPSAA